jgi:hypothetical protein
VRTGGSVKGSGGSNSTGALDVDVDDLFVAPEPSAAASVLVALVSLLLRRGRGAPARRLARCTSRSALRSA